MGDSQQPQATPSAGIFWMLATMFFFVSLDALAKYLMASYPTVQVIWARFFFHTLFVAIIVNRKLLATAASSRLGLQLCRSVLMLVTNGAFFIGISNTPLATASTIMFLSPIFLTVLAIPLLGERVGFRRWGGVIVGFAGALIVVRPDAAGISSGLLFLLVAALANALYQIATRKVRSLDSEITSVLFTGLIGTIAASLVVPLFWKSPAGFDWLLLMALGLLGILGHLCLVRAFTSSEASVVAPFSYSSLIWATSYGFMLFGEVPDRYTLLGAALIITSGLYIFYRERRIV